MPDKTPTIYAKMYAIMSEVGVIEKDKKNSFQNYEYASEFAIKKALQPLLIKHGVLFTLTISDQSIIEGKDSKGQDKLTTLAKIGYTFTSVEDGSFLTGEFAGQGQDAGDKGLYKAITGAIKYILTSSFLIPTGDDPEDDTKPTPVRATATYTAPKQAEPINEPLPTEDDPYSEENDPAPPAGFKTITVMGITEKEAKNGAPFLSLETNLGRMSVFDAKLFDKVNEGSISALIEKKGDYMNIKDIA